MYSGSCWSNCREFPERDTNLILNVDQETLKNAVCVLALSSRKPHENLFNVCNILQQPVYCHNISRFCSIGSVLPQV